MQDESTQPMNNDIRMPVQRVSEIVETIQHDRRALETNDEESNARLSVIPIKL